MQASALGHFMRDSGPWTYAIVNLAHVLGIATLFGSILVLDLRLIGSDGACRSRRCRSSIVPVAATGFVIAATTGIGLFATKATEYVGNPFLLIKFPAIALGLMNVAARPGHVRPGARIQSRDLTGKEATAARGARRCVSALLVDGDHGRTDDRVLVAEPESAVDTPKITPLHEALEHASRFVDRVTQLNAQYRAGKIRVHVPRGLHDSEASLEDLVGQLLPASHAALQAASQGLFFSLPVAFDPSESVGPYLARGRSRHGGPAIPVPRHGRAASRRTRSARTIPMSSAPCSSRCRLSSTATRTLSIRRRCR